MNELKELADQAQRIDEEPGYQLEDLKEGFNVQPDDFRFVAAATPGMVLRLIAQIEALQQQQVQLSQTVAALAEQNAALVSAVSGLRQTVRLMVGAVVLAFIGIGGLVLSTYF